MTSIQKQAAELAEAAACAVDDAREAHAEAMQKYSGGYKPERIKYAADQVEKCQKIAALLRQIASMGGDVEPVAEIVLQEIGAPFRAMQVRAHFFSAPPTPGGKLFTQQALDTARMAGFEAGRRKGLEDAAGACDKISSHSVTVGYRNGALDSAALIRFLINKEA